MKILITGGCGFLGSNLAEHGIIEGHAVMVYDDLRRQGSRFNLDWLRTVGAFEFILGDVRDSTQLTSAVKAFSPDVIFHLAGQVAMTTSINDPRMDFEVNALGTINLLETVRMFSPDAIIVYSSTNKVYGDLEQYSYLESDLRYTCVDHPQGFNELTPLQFESPYGCSKGAADQYMLDYNRVFGLNTVVFRHSSMYGGRQFATADQGWIGWFVSKALEAKSGNGNPFTVSGNGKQVRDILHAADMVNLYFTAATNIDQVKGQAFNIGGGINNSLSILELLKLLEEFADVKLDFTNIQKRQSDQRFFVADTTKIRKAIGWETAVSVTDGIRRMVSWVDKSGISK